MLAAPKKPAKTLAKKAEPNSKTVSLAEAKAHLSAVISGVERSRLPVTVLRRGVPVAQIVPVEQVAPPTGYGWMRGTVQVLGDIVGPTGVEWTVGDE